MCVYLRWRFVDTPKGWLGMLLGTRLWFAFFDAEHDDAPTFEERLDSAVQQFYCSIGSRNLVIECEVCSELWVFAGLHYLR